MPAEDAPPVPWWGLGSAAFALLAVLIELTSSAWANSPVPSWLEPLAPIGWPTPLRVLWWLGVAAAVAAFHVASARSGARRHPVLVIASVLPFVAFAYGVGVGAQWATWH